MKKYSVKEWLNPACAETKRGKDFVTQLKDAINVSAKMTHEQLTFLTKRIDLIMKTFRRGDLTESIQYLAAYINTCK